MAALSCHVWPPCSRYTYPLASPSPQSTRLAAGKSILIEDDGGVKVGVVDNESEYEEDDSDEEE